MESADVLAVEDTRRLHRLASDLEVTLSGRVVTFHESVERARLPGLLAALADGAAAVCRELTKTHEEIRRGPLASLAEWAAEGVRGEITLVVAGAVAAPVELSTDELAGAVAAEEAAGATRKDAIRAVVVRTGL